MKRIVLACLIAVLAGCATKAPPPDSIPGKRHTTQELLSYKPADFHWTMTERPVETAMLDKALTELRARLALPPGPEAEAALPDILGAVMLFNTEVDAARGPTLAALANPAGLAARPPEYQRAVLSAVHLLYAKEAAPLLWPLLPLLSTPREFAAAAYTLLKAQPEGVTRDRILAAMVVRFDLWSNEPRLRALNYALQTQPLKPPPLADLFAAPLRPGYPAVFSVQSKGREFMGLALLRGADGRFVREADGSLFQVPQLARALSNLPGTVTLGNTPQGLFTVRGASTAENPWIGPTPFLETKLPIEAKVAEFEHQDSVVAEWTEPLYESFLPPSWQQWEPIKEAWLAGRAGRDEILMHGTVVNPLYYAGASYAPGTPSAGCLVASETWDASTGRLLQSDQLRLAQAFARATMSADAMSKGYLVVVELPGAARPVTAAELADAVLAAEAKAVARP
ncbi:hypothetical protein BH11PSE10_BH11PSE10_15110 [soil metagenome]